MKKVENPWSRLNYLELFQHEAMDVARHHVACNFGIDNFYEINDADVTGTKVSSYNVTHDGHVTEEEVKLEINLTVELICCAPERFRVNVTKREH